MQNPQLQRNVPITDKHAKLKIVKMSQLEFGTGGWPPISTWITKSPTKVFREKSQYNIIKNMSPSLLG
jgi:hypothetical protein